MPRKKGDGGKSNGSSDDESIEDLATRDPCPECDHPQAIHYKVKCMEKIESRPCRGFLTFCKTCDECCYECLFHDYHDSFDWRNKIIENGDMRRVLWPEMREELLNEDKLNSESYKQTTKCSTSGARIQRCKRPQLCVRGSDALRDFRVKNRVGDRPRAGF